MREHHTDLISLTGNAYCIQENFKEALSCFEKAIEFDPQNSAAMYNLANTHYVLENHEMASEFFEKAVALEPHNIEWHNYIGGVYFGKNDFDNARRHFELAAAINSDNVDNNYRFAQLNLAEHAHHKALEYIKVINPLYYIINLLFVCLCHPTPSSRNSLSSRSSRTTMKLSP